MGDPHQPSILPTAEMVKEFQRVSRNVHHMTDQIFIGENDDIYEYTSPIGIPNFNEFVIMFLVHLQKKQLEMMGKLDRVQELMEISSFGPNSQHFEEIKEHWDTVTAECDLEKNNKKKKKKRKRSEEKLIHLSSPKRKKIND